MLPELSVFYGFFQGPGMGPRLAVFCDSTSHFQAPDREGGLFHSILRAGKHPRLKGSRFHGPPLILDVTVSWVPHQSSLKGTRHVEVTEYAGLGLCVWMDLGGWLGFYHPSSSILEFTDSWRLQRVLGRSSEPAAGQVSGVSSSMSSADVS